MVKTLARVVAPLLVMVALVLGTASMASAQQYPPNGGGVENAGINNNNGGGGTNSGTRGTSANSGSLARTGSNLTPLALLGGALVLTGGFWMLSSRRVRSHNLQ